MQDALNQAIQLHQQGDLRGAVQAYKSLLVEYGQKAHTLYLMGVAYYGMGEFDSAIDALELAYGMNPNHAPTTVCLAHCLVKLDALEPAEAFYREALSIQPAHAEASLNLVQLLAQRVDACIDAKDFESAEALVAEMVMLAPDLTQVIEACAALAFAQDRLEDAEAEFRKLLVKTPENALTHFNLGNVFFRQKKYGWAFGAFKSALERDSSLHESYLLAGKSAVHQNYWNQAYDLLGRYKEIVATPEDADFNYYYGCALAHNERAREGIVLLQKYLLEKPNHIDALIALGNAFRTHKNYVASIQSFDRVLAIDPDHFDALFCSSLSLREYKENDKNEHLERALKHGLRVLEMKPGDVACEFNLANIYMDFGLPTYSIVHYKNALAKDKENISSESSCCFNCNYLDDVTREALFEQHQSWGSKYVDCLKEERFACSNIPDSQRKIRLGFISPDFCIHPVAYFFKPVLEALDKGAFEVFLYYNNFDKKADDAISLALKAEVSHWHEIQGMAHKDLAQLIHGHEVDILIDLAGHSCGQRLIALAYKPAPIQMTWLGYPNTTGSSAIDFRIVDAITDPAEDQCISTERLLPLPEGFNCYNMPYNFPPSTTVTPAVENGYITFGSFNNTCKHNPSVLRLWGRLVKAVPEARLVFKDKFLAYERTKNYILEHVCAGGLEPERVQFLEFSVTNYAHVEQYARLDIALDPHPYNGTTTTCESLLMGVPILTRLGDRHASRVTASVLTRIGLEDWIARDDDHLIELASEKAADIAALSALRPTLRQRMLDSSVCDAKRFVRGFETTLRNVWAEWCSKLT